MKRLLLVLIIPLFFTQLVTAQSNREILRLGRGTANALDWRPDGEVLAVGSGTGIWLYDENFETLTHLEDTETGNVQTVKWSPEGDRLAIANDMGTLQIWEIADDNDGEVAIRLDEVGTSVEWSPNGDRLAVTRRDDTVSIINAIIGSEILRITDVTYSEWTQPGLAWSPNGEYFAVGTLDSIQIWDKDTGEVVQTIIDERLLGYTLDWSPDGSNLSTLCSQITDERDVVIAFELCRWDYSTGEQVNSFELGAGPFLFIRQALWSSDWSQLAYIVQGVGRGAIGDPISVIGEDHTAQHIGSGYAAAWKPNSDILAIADVQGIMRNYDVSTREIIAESNFHTPALTSIAFSPDGTRIAATGFGFEFPVNIWNTATNGFLDTPALTFTPEIVDTVEWTPNGREIVTFGNNRGDTVIDYMVMKWDTTTGEPSESLYAFYSQFESLPILGWNSDFTKSAQSRDFDTVEISSSVSVSVSADEVRNIIWSPNDSTIATISRDIDSDVFLVETWDVQTGNRVGLIEYDAQLHQLLWSPDGTSFAILGIHMGQYGTYFLNVYGLETGISSFELVVENSLLPAMSWNNASNLLAIYSSETVGIYNVLSGESILTIPAYRIRSLSWSPDDTRLAGGSADGTIRIWDVSDLAPLAP